MLENYATAVRVIVMGGITLSALAFVVQVVVSIRYLSEGQRALAGAIICWMIYIVDACRGAIEAGLEWHPRMIPLVAGLVAFILYMLEPRSLKLLRWGQHPLDPPRKRRQKED